MKIKKLWTLIVIILIIGIIIGISLIKKMPKGEPLIKIGAILPLTGELGFVGQWMQEGIQVAMEIFKGNNIKVLFYDSAGTATEAVTIFRKLMATKEIDILISALTPVSMPLVNLADENKIPLFITIVSYPNVAKGKQYVFRYHFAGDQEANTLVQFMFTNQIWQTIPKKAVVLYENNDYGLSIAEAIEKFVVQGKGIITDKIAYDPNQRDFREIVLKAKAPSPKFVYVIGTGKTLGFLIRELLTVSVEWNILSTNAATVSSVLEVLGGKNYTIYCTMPEFIKMTGKNVYENEIASQFVQVYKKKYGKIPSFIAAEAFDVIYIILNLSKSNKISFTQSDLENRQFNLSMGNVSFSPNGDFVIPIFVGTIRNGKFEF